MDCDVLWSLWWFPEIGVPSNHPFLTKTIHFVVPPFMESPLYHVILYLSCRCQAMLSGMYWMSTKNRGHPSAMVMHQWPMPIHHYCWWNSCMWYWYCINIWFCVHVYIYIYTYSPNSVYHISMFFYLHIYIYMYLLPGRVCAGHWRSSAALYLSWDSCCAFRQNDGGWAGLEIVEPCFSHV